MLKINLILMTCVLIPFVASWRGFLLGPGRWMVLDISPCEGQYDFVFDKLGRKKINRTHDCFDVSMNLDKEFNFTYGVQIDIFQKLDGGFKYFQTMADDCACTFIKKYSEDNFRRALANAKVENADCPIGPGPIMIQDFVMDYSKLPTSGVYGTFEVKAYAILHRKKRGCMKIILTFDDRNGEESDEGDD